MAATNDARIDEIADSIYRISIPVPPSAVPGGFSFNQYLILDDEPLLFHTGPRRTFPFVQAAVVRVMPIERLRWIGLSHFEADECGALNAFLAAAPQAARSEEHTSELQSLMRISYAVVCLKKKKKQK